MSLPNFDRVTGVEYLTYLKGMNKFEVILFANIYETNDQFNFFKYLNEFFEIIKCEFNAKVKIYGEDLMFLEPILNNNVLLFEDKFIRLNSTTATMNDYNIFVYFVSGPINEQKIDVFLKNTSSFFADFDYLKLTRIVNLITRTNKSIMNFIINNASQHILFYFPYEMEQIMRSILNLYYLLITIGNFILEDSTIIKIGFYSPITNDLIAECFKNIYGYEVFHSIQQPLLEKVIFNKFSFPRYISGATTYDHLIWKGKDIFLFGDLHEYFLNMCNRCQKINIQMNIEGSYDNNCLSVSALIVRISKCFEGTGYEADVFYEFPKGYSNYTLAEHYDHMHGDQSLGDLSNLFYGDRDDKIPKLTNINFHSSDLRTIINEKNNLINIHYLIDGKNKQTSNKINRAKYYFEQRANIADKLIRICCLSDNFANDLKNEFGNKFNIFIEKYGTYDNGKSVHKIRKNWFKFLRENNVHPSQYNKKIEEAISALFEVTIVHLIKDIEYKYNLGIYTRHEYETEMLNFYNKSSSLYLTSCIIDMYIIPKLLTNNNIKIAILGIEHHKVIIRFIERLYGESLSILANNKYSALIPFRLINCIDLYPIYQRQE